jgi:hypothetical protein
MAAHEALGRQFLDRHLIEHHGWHQNWINDYNELDEPSNPHFQEGGQNSRGALNAGHQEEHDYADRWGWNGETVSPARPEVPHSHSPERIHFH